MGIGRESGSFDSTGRTVVGPDRCWEDRWVEGSYLMVRGDNAWEDPVAGPFWQNWTMRVSAEACSECFCSKCVTSACAEKERDQGDTKEKFDGDPAADDPTPGFLSHIRGKFLIRPISPQRRGFCQKGEGEGAAETCKCKKCIPWKAGSQLSIKVYYNTLAESQVGDIDDVKAVAHDDLRSSSMVGITGAWAGCDCYAFVAPTSV